MTEKDYNPEQKMKRKMSVETSKTNKTEIAKSPTHTRDSAYASSKNDGFSKEENKETKPEVKQEKKEIKVVKKTKSFATAKGVSMPISTKQAIAICKFIKGKTIIKAVDDLEEVVKMKRAVPMKGEIPHRRNMENRIMSGRFPKNASQEFINLLKSLGANANMNGIDEPVVVEAMANMASRPYGRFGRIRKKRTHVFVKAGNKKIKIKRGEKN